jgi:flagellar protein FliS
MSSSNAYHAAQAYRDVSIAVSPLKAIVMLFDGTIMSLRKSMVAREARRFEESHHHLIRATTILRGLSHHLNPAKGEKLAKRLFKTYNALIIACLRAHGRPDAPILIQRIIGSLTELRDAWSEVAREKYKMELQGRR